MNKVSVIIPVYNAEKFISNTLDSVINQSYRNYEIIIINDGSTDNTGIILNEYYLKYPSLITIVDQKNMGQSAARNNALAYVNGDYITFLDADDLLLEDYLEKLVIAIEKNDAEIAICGYEKFDTKTKENLYVRMPFDWEIMFNNNISHVFHYSPCAKLFKTSFIQKYHLRFSEGEQLEDGPYCCLAQLLANKVVSLDYIGYQYRVYEDSTMGKVRKKNSKPNPPYNGVKDLIEKFNEYNSNEDKKLVMEYCVVKILTGFLTNMYKNCDNETRKNLSEFCYEIMNQYFSNISKNPYIKISKLKKLPIVHRVAVKLFVLAYKLNLLYPFSLCVSKVL